VVLLVVAVVLARDGRAPTTPTAAAVVPAANQVVRINPATLEESAAVAVGTDPGAVIAGGGLVWVANRRDGTVTVVDPDTNRVQETLPPSGSGPVGQGGPGLAYAGGSLWVANATERRVARMEPGADPIPVPVGGSPNAIVAAQDTVWVAVRTPGGGGRLARVDAGTNQAVTRLRLRHPPTGLVITPDGRTVWVATAGDQSIRRVDTGAGGAVGRIRLGQAPDQMTFGGDDVWVTSSTGDAVLRVDADTSQVKPSIRVGNGPSGIAFGADRVWVTTPGTARSRPSTRRPTTSAPSAWGSGRPPWPSTSARSGSPWPPDPRPTPSRLPPGSQPASRFGP
jgi:YVTN family beta-propeller protein